MTRVRFIHTSDLQIGMTRWFLGQDQSLFDDSRLAAIRRLGELATETGSEFIVVAGDVFEHNSLSERVIGRALEALRALPVPVYLLPGNHDPLVADNIFRRTEGVEGVHVVTSTEPLVVSGGDSGGVEIVGAPWRSKFPVGDLVRAALEPLAPSSAIRIGLAHGQSESRSSEAVAGLIDLGYVDTKLADGTLDYLALGDTHSTASLGGSGRVWFSGAPETTDFAEQSGGGENDSGNALVVTIEKEGLTSEVEVVKHRVGRWSFEALSADLYSAEDIEDFFARLDAYPEKERTVIKYALSGTLTLTDTQTLQQGIETRQPVFAALYERERLMDLHLEPGDDEIEHLSVGGVAQGALAELFDDPDDPIARDAVNLMFRLAKES